MSAHQPLGGKLWTKPFALLAILVAVMAIILIQRFVLGLGAVTNMNDGYPFGIWVVIDMVVGTGFGCGGFALALVVYILNKGEYHPLMRPALMAGLFGYTLGGLSIVADLGRYWNVYHLFLPQFMQPNSVMFEVAICVTAYILVLFIEFTPVFLERVEAPGLKALLKKSMFFFIALGVLLPTMHQSSLGTLLIILGHQLSPLWQTQLLPALYLISALSMGYAIVIFEGLLAAASFRRPFEADILGRLSGIMFWMIVVYLVLRFADLIMRGALGGLMTDPVDGLMFLIENGLYVVAVAILAVKVNRESPRMLFLSAFCMLLAGTLYRIDSYLVGYHPGNGWAYYPSVTEILVTVGIFSLEVVLYLIFVKKLPVLTRLEKAS